MTLDSLLVCALVALWPLAGGLVLGLAARAVLGGTPNAEGRSTAGLVAAMWLWPVVVAGLIGIALFTVVAGDELPANQPPPRLARRTRAGK